MSSTLGEQLMREVLAGDARHYNGHNPHKGPATGKPRSPPGRVVEIIGRIERRSVVGGLISEYHGAT